MNSNWFYLFVLYIYTFYLFSCLAYINQNNINIEIIDKLCMCAFVNEMLSLSPFLKKCMHKNICNESKSYFK